MNTRSLYFLIFALSPFGLTQSYQVDMQTSPILHSFAKVARKVPAIQTGVATGIIASILEDQPDVIYHGTTLGKANLLFHQDGVTFQVAASDMGQAGRFQMRFPEASTRLLLPKSPTGGVTNIIHDDRSWLGLPNFGALCYQQLFQGVDAVFSADARRLKQAFQISAGAEIQSLQWSFPGATIDERVDGTLRIVSAGREFILGGLTATQADKELGATFAFTGDRIGIVFSSYQAELPLTVCATLVFDAYFDDFGCQTTEEATYLTGTTASLLDHPTKPTTDVFVARLNQEQTATEFTAIIGGSGSDVGIALILGSNGNLYVTGSTASADFPITQGSLQGKRDAFLVCLGPSGDQIGGGLYVGGEGDDSGQTLLQYGDGRLFMAGVTTSLEFPQNNAPIDFKTVFPRTASGQIGSAGQVTYFAADVSDRLDRVLASALVEGPQLFLPLAAAMVEKEPCFGLEGIEAARATQVCYTMNEYSENYSNPADKAQIGFGYYALLWKKYRAVGSQTYSPTGAQATGTVPIDFSTTNYYLQAGTLNTLENTTSVFMPDDPGGTWQYDSFTNAVDRILANIFWLHRWKTPIFTEEATSTTSTEDVAIREMCMESTDALYPGVEDLCDLTVNLFADITCSGSLLTYFSLDNWKIARWTTTTYVPHEEITWPLAVYPFLQAYIYDPPVEDEGAAPLIKEAARQLRQRITTKQPIDVVSYSGGKITDQSQTSWRVKMAAVYP